MIMDKNIMNTDYTTKYCSKNKIMNEPRKYDKTRCFKSKNKTMKIKSNRDKKTMRNENNYPDNFPNAY